LQLGFVIDHARCIGCHACTVACKAENDVPLGSFRTWVKYTETGAFPDVRRSFAVLRCNQCTDAPCVTICPVGALDKRPDGIVDVDPQRCIGCKACLQGCPYDALYLNDARGTVEKCHFCAHRTEIGLAPACAVVCPTEAIVPGDFDDPASRVTRMKAAGGLVARKTEAGTRPNVWYREVDAAGIDPLATRVEGGYLWAGRMPGAQVAAEEFDALDARAAARTTYDVDHAPAWGPRVSAYLWTKSVAAGVLVAALPLAPPFAREVALSAAALAAVAGVALAFLAITTVLLVADLKRPERFLYILRYGNRNSWLAKGAWVLAGYGTLAGIVFALGAAGAWPGGAPGAALLVATAVAAAGTASYTAWLFRQAKGRVLWMQRGLAASLLVHAVAAGAAVLLGLAPLLGIDGAGAPRALLAAALVLHLAFAATEGRRAPRGRATEYARAVRLVSHGPFALARWTFGVALGAVLPLALLASSDPAAWTAAGVLALVGLAVEQDVLVRAGQALPIS